MKNLIITDLHMGANNNNINYHGYQRNIFINTIIEYIQKHDVQRLKIIGDIFHHKKLIDVYILNSLKEMFSLVGIPIDIILGNHDLYYSNSNEMTSVSSLKEIKNINIIDDIQCNVEDGQKVMYVPYPNTEDMISNFIKQVNEFKPDILYGHIDVNDFYMANNIKINKGFNRKILANIKLVVLGHIHQQQQSNNINYIGPPWDINWGDSFSPKCFCTIEQGTTELEYHKQEDKYFQYYNVNVKNHKEIIKSITSNPEREFKFKLDEDVPDFIDFIETKFEKPENIKSIITKLDDGDDEEIEINDSLTTKEIIDEQIKHDNDLEDKDLAFSILHHLESKTLNDIKNEEVTIL